MSTMKFVIQNCYTRMLYKNVIQNIIHNLTRFKVNIGYIYGYHVYYSLAGLNIVYLWVDWIYKLKRYPYIP